MSYEDQESSLSERVGNFASGFKLSQVSEEEVLRAKLSILDAIGVAMASTRYDFAYRTHTGIAAMGDMGNAPVIGMWHSPKTLDISINAV